MKFHSVCGTVVISAIARTFDRGEPSMQDALDVSIRNKSLIDICADQYSKCCSKLVLSRLQDEIRLKDVNYKKRFIDRKTQGALATLGLALPFIESQTYIVFQPFDSLILDDLTRYIEFFRESQCAVGLLTVEARTPDHSFVRVVKSRAVEIVEKNPISNIALTGVVYFQNLQVLLECIEWSLLNRIQTLGQYYLAPSVNAQIALGKQVEILEVPTSSYYRFTTFDNVVQNKSRLEATSEFNEHF
jgi:hypothetical protein